MSQDFQQKNQMTTEKPEDMFSALNDVSNQLDAIQKFVARRFDEISMEVNATAQQMDMAEGDTSKKFNEIFEVLHAISFSDGGNTPANTGVELDAVIETTEKAANTILDAAERIGDTLHAVSWEDETARAEAIQKIDNDLQDILMACSFQDVTGQRIHKTLENIRSIEDRLGGALKNMGIEVEKKDSSNSESLGKSASQSEIDDIFGS